MHIYNTLYKIGLLAIIALTSACSTVDVMVEPSKEASFFGDKQVNNFGVCASLDRRGTRLYMWQEFLRQNSTSGGYTDFHITGYEVGVARGESCHLRILDTYQAAVQFDLSSLPSSAVTSAELQINFVKHAGTDPPYLFGRDNCTVLMIGIATEAWDDGRFGPSLSPPGVSGTDTTRPWLSWRPLLRDRGPHERFRTRIDVTREVSEWARGVRPNHGFVITPDLELVNETYNSTDTGGFTCPLWLLGYELHVTVAVPD